MTGSRRSPAPTLDPSLDALLGELVDRVRAHFGSDLVGAYLVGSFGAGDADAHSDVDWLVVLRREVSSDELPALDALHAGLYARPTEWAKHLEGSYPSAAALAAPPDGRPWPYLDNGATALTYSDHDNSWVVRWSLRERGIALAGPPPESLVPEVPPGSLADEVTGLLTGWAREMADHPERIDASWLQGFLVVGVCRMLETLATGEVRSKASAVAFARRDLEPRWTPLVESSFAERARQVRGPGSPTRNAAMRPEATRVAETVAFVRYALEVAPRFRSPRR